MYPDQEINALNCVYEALAGLNQAQIKRIIDWVTSKFGLEKKPDLKVVEKESGSLAQTSPAPVESAPPAVKPVKTRRGPLPAKADGVVEEKAPQPSESEIKGFMKYDTFQDLFFSSNAKTITAKILLASAYLQENKKIKGFVSSDINSLMKKIGQEIANISASINVLLNRQPPLLTQTGKLGSSRQARRTYAVTEEGLRIAINYINE